MSVGATTGGYASYGTAGLSAQRAQMFAQFDADGNVGMGRDAAAHRRKARIRSAMPAAMTTTR